MKNIIIPHKDGLLLNRDIKLTEGNWRIDDTYKFIFCIEGENVFQSKTDIKLAKNNYLVLNPLVEHRQLFISDEKFLVELEASFLNKLANNLGLKSQDIIFAYHPNTNEHMTRWTSFIKDYFSYSDDTLDHALFLENSLHQLAIILIKFGLGSHNSKFHQTKPNAAAAILDKVLSALKEGYDANWTLDKMSDIANISKYQFSHLFKENIGISPYSWLQLYRISKSQMLLLESNKPVVEIAMECGFTSLNVFNSLFKRIYHITPTKFRARYRTK